MAGGKRHQPEQVVKSAATDRSRDSEREDDGTGV